MKFCWCCIAILQKKEGASISKTSAIRGLELQQRAHKRLTGNTKRPRELDNIDDNVRFRGLGLNVYHTLQGSIISLASISAKKHTRRPGKR